MLFLSQNITPSLAAWKEVVSLDCTGMFGRSRRTGYTQLLFNMKQKTPASEEEDSP